MFPRQPFLCSGAHGSPKEVCSFLKTWSEHFEADKRIVLDQLLFREQIYEQNLRVHVLPNTYNARLREPVHMSGLVKIVHAHVYSDVGNESWETSSAFAGDFINSTFCNRIFSPHDGRLTWMDMEFVMHDKLLAEHHPLHEREEFLHPELNFDEHVPCKLT